MSVDRSERRFTQYAWILFGLYFLTHFWLLLNRGIFWDDWVWTPNPEEGARAILELGTPILGQISLFFNTIKHGEIYYKYLIFLDYLAVTIGFFYILTKEKILDIDKAFWAAAIVAVFPVNNARITLCTGNYSICLALFVVASIFLLQGKTWAKIISVPMFLISFFTNSLLVFFAVPIFLLYRKEQGLSDAKKQNFKGFIKSNWYLIILPPTFWIFKKVFLPVHGLYADYNQIRLNSTAINPEMWIHSFAQATVVPFFYAFTEKLSHHRTYIVAIILFFLLLIWIRRRRKENYFRHIHISLALFFLGALPYLAVNKTPGFLTWDSRHQLLLPFAVAFFFLGATKQLATHFKKLTDRRLLIFVLLVGVIVNWQMYAAFQRDWVKQLALIEAVKQNSVLRENTTFEMYDDSPYWKMQGLGFAFYNYNGILRKAFGDQTRFAAGKDEIRDFILHPENLEPLLREGRRYNMADYNITPPQFEVRFKVSEEKSLARTFELLTLEWLRPEKFQTELIGLMTLETRPWK